MWNVYNKLTTHHNKLTISCSEVWGAWLSPSLTYKLCYDIFLQGVDDYQPCHVHNSTYSVTSTSAGRNNDNYVVVELNTIQTILLNIQMARNVT